MVYIIVLYRVVVMLTAVVESCGVKCNNYWPDSLGQSIIEIELLFFNLYFISVLLFYTAMVQIWCMQLL